MQTIQRQAWTNIILTVVGTVFGLIIIGWVAGAIVNSFNESPAEVAWRDLQAQTHAEQISGVSENVDATLRWSGDVEYPTLRVTGLPDLPPDSEFVAWWTVEDVAVQAGRFTPTEGSTAITFIESDRPDGAGMLITIEPNGPVSQPSSREVVTLDPAE